MDRHFEKGQVIRKTYQAVETKAVDETNRTLVVRISTGNPDRSKDIVIPNGMISDNYERNPVVAFAHNYAGVSIGKTIDLQQTEEGIIAKLQFVPKGVVPLADQLWELYKGGFMNAWSIGFVPVEFSQKDDGGYIFSKWELLEYSAVLVPDNPDALTLLRSKGIKTDAVETAVEDLTKKSEDADPSKPIEVETPPGATAGPGDTNATPTPAAPETVVTPETNTPPTESKDIDVEVKEGRVLSDKNKKVVMNAITALKGAQDALEALMKATEKEEPKDDKKSYDADLNPDDRLVRVVQVLKQADKLIGIGLRDAKATSSTADKGDESRVLPIAIGEKGVE